MCDADLCIDPLAVGWADVFGLLVRVPLGRREVCAQLLRCATWTVPGHITLNPPPLLQRTGIHGVEPELVEQARHRGLGSGVVASDD
jgi:hypothetical protein